MTHEENEVLARAIRASHTVKKRGKREAEQQVVEYTRLVADPSDTNIADYVQRRATNSSASAKLGERYASAIRAVIAKLERIVSQSVAWRSEQLDDLVELLIRSNYLRYEKALGIIDTLARKDALSAAQVGHGFSTSVKTGLVSSDSDSDSDKAKHTHLPGFRW